MLKLGITTMRGLTRPRSWLGRSRHASLLLFARLAERGHDGAEAYDRLVERVRLPNGTWKQTAGGRLDDVDDLIAAALRASHPLGARISVLDLGASTGVTSAALYDRLGRTYQVHFVASDLYRDAIAVSGHLWTVVLTASGDVLQYVIGPFVLPGQLDESPFYVVNRLLKAAARRWLTPRARRAAAAAATLPYLTARREGATEVVRLPLFSFHCLDRARRGDFTFEVTDVLRPLSRSATVVRAMNVVTRDYFDEHTAGVALANCIDAVEPGGLLVIGRSTGLTAGHTRATCYRVDAARRLRPIARLSGGDELELLTLRVSRSESDSRSSAASVPANGGGWEGALGMSSNARS